MACCCVGDVKLALVEKSFTCWLVGVSACWLVCWLLLAQASPNTLEGKRECLRKEEMMKVFGIRLKVTARGQYHVAPRFKGLNEVQYWVGVSAKGNSVKTHVDVTSTTRDVEAATQLQTRTHTQTTSQT